MTDRTEGNTYYQTLTFERVPGGNQLQMLEVLFMLFRQDLPPASMTLPLAGHAIGDRIPLDTSLTTGRDTLRVHAATLEAQASSTHVALR